MMRILHTESASGWGGQEIRVINEVEQMQRRGHHVILACNESTYLWKAAYERHLNLIHVPLGKPKLKWKAIAELNRIIRSEKIEIVNTHSSDDSWVAAIAAKQTKSICVRSRHISNPIKPHIFNRILYNWLTEAFIVTGEPLRQDIIERNGIDPQCIISVPSGVEKRYFLRETYDAHAIRKELNVDSSAFLWVMTAFIRSMKGHSVLLNAASILQDRFPDTVYAFIGGMEREGVISEELLNQTRELGLENKCHFLGTRDDVPQLLAGCDAFVLPSTRSEGLPQGLTQAMAMGLPAISTKVGAIPEVVKDKETGYLVEPNDPEQLAAAMAEVMSHPDEAQRRAVAGQQLIQEKYSLEAMVDKVEQFYQYLLRQNK